MKNSIRLGDLVSTTGTYHPPVMKYGHILEIIDYDDNNYDSLILITGQGNENSKIKIKIKWFAELGESYSFDIPTFIKEIKEDVTTETNLHNILVVSNERFKSLIKGYQTNILKINEKIDFLEKNRNIIEVRDEKINKILY
jgi:hypothetical protein